MNAQLQPQVKATSPPTPSFMPTQIRFLQRKCACGSVSGPDGECEGCRRKHLALQRRSIDQGEPPTTLISAGALRSSTSAADGPGLSEGVRGMMEKRFGTSFADVRIHADNTAGQTAGALGAKAFTKGRDIYFAPGYYRPDSQAGLGLLAHELTHVVQQRNGRFPVGSGSDNVADARSRLEDEAEAAARTIQSSTQPLQIVEKALGNEVHRSPGLLDDMRGAATGNIEALADSIMQRLGETADPQITQLNQLRVQLRGLRYVTLSQATIAELEVIYSRFRALAPRWVPVPNIRFAGPPVQQAPLVLAGVAVGAAELALLATFVLLVWWVVMSSNPEYRRQRDKEFNRVIEILRNAARPETRPAPESETAPETPPHEEEAPRSGVRPKERAPKLSTEPKPPPEIGPLPPLLPPISNPAPEKKPKEKDRRCRPDPCPEPLPIRWPMELPLPDDMSGLVRTPSDVREAEGFDPRGAPQARFATEIAEARRRFLPPPQPCDPDVELDDSRWNAPYDAHHKHPLYLGGLENENAHNLCALEAQLHQRGHPRLDNQSDLLDIYMQCGICSGRLKDHPAYQRYFVLPGKK